MKPGLHREMLQYRIKNRLIIGFNDNNIWIYLYIYLCVIILMSCQIILY